MSNSNAIKIVNYANKRYNAGIMYNQIVTTTLANGDIETAYVDLTKKQAVALQKSIKTIAMQEGASAVQNDAHTYSNSLESAIKSKYAELAMETSTIH
jgi:NurA-like 5'-3' nuclease